MRAWRIEPNLVLGFRQTRGLMMREDKSFIDELKDIIENKIALHLRSKEESVHETPSVDELLRLHRP